MLSNNNHDLAEYITPTQKNHDYYSITLISKELDSVPKYDILEPTRPRSSVGRALG